MKFFIKFPKENEKLKSSARACAATSEYNSDSIFDSYNAEDEERDTCFVLAALTESKETLKMLVWDIEMSHFNFYFIDTSN